MLIRADGNVGIGASIPAEKLSVLSADNTLATNIFAARAANATQGIGISYTGIRKITNNSSNDLNIDAASTGNVIINASGGSGGLLVGTSTGLLDAANRVTVSVNGTSSSALAFGVSGTRYGHIYCDTAELAIANGAGSGGYIDFQTNGNERVRINSSGNVGIGTTSPAKKLHISGDVLVDNSTNSTIFLSNDYYKYITVAPSTGDYLAIAQNPFASGIQFGKSTNGAPSSFVDLMTLNVSGQLMMRNSSGTNFNVLKASGFGYNPSSYMALVVGATSGNTTVCIGVDPSGISSSAFSGLGSEVMFRNVGSFITPNSGNTGFNSILAWDSSGNIGIGTSSPSGKLHVNGVVYAGGRLRITREDSSSEGGQLELCNAASNAVSWYFDAYGSSSTPDLRIFDASAVGVKLVSGSTSWSTMSDINLKTDLQPIVNAVDTLKDIRCVTYHLKDKDQPTSKKRIGIIAQDIVGKIDEALDFSSNEEGGQEYLSVRYTELIPHLIKAVQELTERIKELESK